VKDGVIVRAEVIAEAWSMTLATLDRAVARGEAFAIVINGRSYCPFEFLRLEPAIVAANCKLFRGVDPSKQLIFWKRANGALGGKTVLEALVSDSPQLACVVALAQRQADERAARRTARAASEFLSPASVENEDMIDADFERMKRELTLGSAPTDVEKGCVQSETCRRVGISARLTDPSWEPSDKELQGLAERAWAAAEPGRFTARQEFEQRLPIAGATAISRIKSRSRVQR
jgi:hypothetical protein